MYFLKKLFEKYFENNETTEPENSNNNGNKNKEPKHFPESSDQLNKLKNDCNKKTGCPDN